MPSLNTGNAILSNPIKVDSSYNVGIGGAASGSFKLQVTGTGNFTGALTGTSLGLTSYLTAVAPSDIFYGMQIYGANGAARKIFVAGQTGFANGLTVDYNGSAFVYAFNEGNVGIGNASPSYKLDVSGTLRVTGAATFSANSTTLNINSSSRVIEAIGKNGFYAAQIIGGSGTNTSYGLSINAGTNSNDVAFQVYNQAESAIRLMVRGDGNVGIGTTPSAWANITALELPYGVSFGSYTGAAIPNNYITNNAFYNGTNWIYKVSSYPATNTSQTSDGSFTFNNAPSGTAGGVISFAERMRITSAGNVGIAVTPSSGIRLQVRAETSDSSSQAMNIGRANGSDLIYVRADGYLYSVGAWSGSDIRLKENIIDLDNGLQKVLGLKAKKFDLIDGLKNNFGFIAQEMQEVIPDAVSVFEEKEQLLAVRMDFIIPHLVKAIQEQQAQIEELKALINK